MTNRSSIKPVATEGILMKFPPNFFLLPHKFCAEKNLFQICNKNKLSPLNCILPSKSSHLAAGLSSI